MGGKIAVLLVFAVPCLIFIVALVRVLRGNPRDSNDYQVFCPGCGKQLEIIERGRHYCPDCGYYERYKKR